MMGARICWIIALCMMAPCIFAGTLTIKMPNVQPKIHDTYLCAPLKLSKTDYIVSFTPRESKPKTAHHMLLYGCDEPGYKDRAWNCGEMHSEESKEFKSGPTCRSGSKIIYAWAMEAPNLTLPKDVGFMIGGKSGIKWLVLQIHYKDVKRFVAGEKDDTGLELKLAPAPTQKVGGVYLLSTGGIIYPNSQVCPSCRKVNMETACPYENKITIHPFAYRTHAHAHGVVNSGYRIRGGKWTEIGRKSPQQPQMFYPVKNKNMDIRKGDILAARCTMKNEEDRVVPIGSTAADEMCNFYIMYWTVGNKLPGATDCWSRGPPNYDWTKYPNQAAINLKGMPKTVSTDPDSGVKYVAGPIKEAHVSSDDDDDEDEDEEDDVGEDGENDYRATEAYKKLRDMLLAQSYDRAQNDYDRWRY